MNNKYNRILGTIFYYYRSTKKLSRYEISLLSKEKNSYLSHSTIKRIEAAKLENNDSSLCKYAHALSLRYEKSEKPYKILRQYICDIVNLVKKETTLKDLENIHKKLYKFNNVYKKCIYLNEISKLLLSVLEDYLYNKKISLDEQRMYEFVVNNVPDEDDEIIIFMYYLLYKSYLFERGNTQDNVSKIKEIVLKANFNKILYLDRIRFDKKDANIVDLYNKYNDIYITCKKDNNRIIARLVTSLFNISCCDILLKNYNGAKKHLEEIFEIEFLDRYIPKYVIYNAYNLLGYVYFNENNYEQAYTYFNKSRKQGGNSISFNYLLLFISAEKTNKNMDAKKIIKEGLEEVKLPAIRNILIYYKLKYSHQDKKILEEHIVKYLNKQELVFGLHCDLIYKELLNLVKETKHYKYLYNYFENELLVS